MHGLQEKGDGNEEIKVNDHQLIKQLMELLGVKEEPKNINRLGKKEPNKNRTLKVIMKTNQDKLDVLQNLRKLKGSEEMFGKISITSDFTVHEREQIKRYVQDAKTKSSDATENVWRGRGDPSKNGLKLVPFPRIKVASA